MERQIYRKGDWRSACGNMDSRHTRATDFTLECELNTLWTEVRDELTSYTWSALEE